MVFVCVKLSYTYLCNSFTYPPVNLPLPLTNLTPFLLTFLGKKKRKECMDKSLPITNLYY